MLLSLVAALAISFGPEIPPTPPVLQPAYSAYDPIAASDGTDYVVAWSDLRGDRLAHVAGDGAVTPKEGTPLPPSIGPAFGRQLVWNGFEYLLLGMDSQLVVTRVSRDGDILDFEPKRVTLPGAPRHVAFNGTSLLAIGLDFATILGPEGDVIRNVPLPAGVGVLLAAGATPDEFLVVTRGLNLFRISADGVLLDSVPRPMAGSPATDVHIAADGSGFVAAWTEGVIGFGRPAKVAHVNSDGSVAGTIDTITLPDSISVGTIDVTASLLVASADDSVWRVALNAGGHDAPVKVAPATNAGGVALAVSRSGLLNVWSSLPWRDSLEPLTTPFPMMAEILQSGAPFPVTFSLPIQRHAEAAFDGRNILTVWSEGNGLFTTGGMIAENHLRVLPFTVGFDGTAFVVVWTEGTRILARRVGRDGVPAGTSLLISETANTPPSEACEPNGACTVVWQSTDWSIHAALLRDGGIVSDQVVTNPHWFGPVDVAFDGRDFAVIFPKPVILYTCPDCPREIEHDVGVMRISTSGVKMEPVDFTFSLTQPLQPVIAWNGTGRGLAIWPTLGRIFAATIDRDLQLLTPIHEVVSDAFLDEARVAFDGVQYVIAWSAHENVTPREIRVTIASQEGDTLGETTTIASPAVNLGSVAGLGGGHAFVSYVRQDGNDGGRAFGRIITDPLSPPRVRAARH